jgi:hypothetical protein
MKFVGLKLMLLIVASAVCTATAQPSGKSTPTNAQATKAAAAKKTSAADKLSALAPSLNKTSVLSTPIRKPATLDPNSAVEVRGQARTLSMMLVLKNGKDSINFIKVRKDYHPEIQSTDY